MKQSIVQLPKNVTVVVNLIQMGIKNHKVEYAYPGNGLLGWIFEALRLGYWMTC